MRLFRNVAVALVAVALVTTAGCGFITGSESLTFSASPATVDEDVRSDAGYEEVNVTGQTVERNFSVADQSRTVEVTNQLAQYERNVDLGPLGSQRAAVFVAFASPEVSVLNQNFNPIREMDSRELLERFESSYEGVEVGDRAGEQNVTLLGTETTLEKYEGSAQLDGQDVPVYVHITDVVEHEGDYVVALAIYPQELSGEEEAVVDLTEGVEHDGS